MLEEKVRIGIKYAKIGILVAFIGTVTQNVLGYFNLIDKALPIILEENLRDWHTIILILITAIVLAPIIEESLFRLLPIGIVFLIWGKENKFILWPVIIISSVIFGWVHGSWQNILIQGSVGIVFSMAFLKGGYISAVVAHAVYNFIAVAVVVIGILFSS